MTAPHSTQYVVSELLSHTEAHGQALVVRELVEEVLEQQQATGQILTSRVTIVSARTIEVLITITPEIYSDLRKIAALTEPLVLLSTDTVTVVPYATFPLADEDRDR
jgi:hypothetical protein